MSSGQGSDPLPMFPLQPLHREMFLCTKQIHREELMEGHCKLETEPTKPLLRIEYFLVHMKFPVELGYRRIQNAEM